MPTVDYRQLYNELFDDVRGLRDDLRAMQLQASDRESAAYEDAWDMTHSLIHQAETRERKKERNEANG